MNTDTPELNPNSQQIAPAVVPAAPEESTTPNEPAPTHDDPEPQTEEPKSPTGHKRNGKIAQLPYAVRTQINTMLLDGAPYAKIKAAIGEHGKDLSPTNFTGWKQGGYLDWLYEQRWREDTRAYHQSALTLFPDSDPVKLNQCALQVAILQMLSALQNLERTGLNQKLGGDSAAYSRLVNALSRACREAINAQKFHENRTATVQLKHKDPNRKLGGERNIVLDRWHDLFGHDLTEPDPAENLERSSRGDEAPINPLPARSSRGNEAQISTDPAPQIQPAEPLANEANVPTIPFVEEASKTEPVHTLQSQTTVLPLPFIRGEGRGEGLPVGLHVHGEASLSAELPSSQDPESSIKDPESRPAIQQSTPVPELCRDCSTPLPRLLPNGTRPHRRCPGCDTLLHPPGSKFDRCQFCNSAYALQENNERLSDFCLRCNNALPPPGRVFLTHCPGCGLAVGGPTAGGNRVLTRCPDCKHDLPLLVPVPTSPDVATEITVAPSQI
jgi:hypothetical protein